MALPHPTRPHTDRCTLERTLDAPRLRWAGKETSRRRGFLQEDLPPLGFTSIESLKELVSTCGLSGLPPRPQLATQQLRPGPTVS